MKRARALTAVLVSSVAAFVAVDWAGRGIVGAGAASTPPRPAVVDQGLAREVARLKRQHAQTRLLAGRAWIEVQINRDYVLHMRATNAQMQDVIDCLLVYTEDGRLLAGFDPFCVHHLGLPHG